jgi:hypothetical protein
MASGLGIVTINKQEPDCRARAPGKDRGKLPCLAAGSPGESPDPRTAGWRKRPYHQDLRRAYWQLNQGNRVKKLCGDKACEEVVIPGGDVAAESEGILSPGSPD